MKSFKTNTKGFTLVELLVAMVIFVFVLAISSAVFVFSTDMYRSSVIDQNDQRLLETISAYVQEELQFAGAISSDDIYSTEQGWHQMSISSEGYLLVDTRRVVTSSLYGRRELKMSFQISDTDKSRIDVTYVLYDGKDEATLKSSIFLTNIDLNISNGAKIGEEEVKTIMGVTTQTLELSNAVANKSNLYYYNGKTAVMAPDIDTPVPPVTGGGTIADIVACVYEKENYQSAITEWNSWSAYVVGQIISYKGEIYRVWEAHNSQANIMPGVGTTMMYQKMSDPNWQINKYYFEGDVIIHNGKYYVRTYNTILDYATEPGSAGDWRPVWRLLDKAPETKCENYTANLDLQKFVGEWKDGMQFESGSIVSYNGRYYKSKKSSNQGSGKHPGEDKSTWNLLHVDPVYFVNNVPITAQPKYRPEGIFK